MSMMSDDVDGPQYVQKGFSFRAVLEGASSDTRNGLVVPAQRSHVEVCQMKPLPIPAEKNEFIECNMSCSISTARHFVCLRNRYDEIKGIEMRLEGVGKDGKLRPLVNPEKGTLALARLPDNGKFARCVVLEKSGPMSTRLFFVDYGPTVSVDPDEIYFLDIPELHDVPPQAFCVTADVEDRKLQERDYKVFKEYSTVSLQLLGVSDDGCSFNVNMLLLCGRDKPKSISEALKEDHGTEDRPPHHCPQQPDQSRPVNVEDTLVFVSAADKLLALRRKCPPPVTQQPVQRRVCGDCQHPPEMCSCARLDMYYHEKAPRSDGPSKRRLLYQERQERNERHGSTVCYKCNEVGHISRDCPMSGSSSYQRSGQGFPRAQERPNQTSRYGSSFRVPRNGADENFIRAATMATAAPSGGRTRDLEFNRDQSGDDGSDRMGEARGTEPGKRRVEEKEEFTDSDEEDNVEHKENNMPEIAAESESKGGEALGISNADEEVHMNDW